MKKFAKWLGVFAVVVCLGAAMLACGGKVEGKYTYKGTQMGVTMKQTIELKKDNKCTITVEVDGETGESLEGTYKIDGDKITITIGGDSQEGTYKKGKSITLTRGDQSMVFKK